MTPKPKIQYIGQFYVYGSEAQALAAKEKKRKPKTKLPMAGLDRIEKIYIDPLALIGIAVSVVMLVAMVAGAVRIQADWAEYEQMSQYVSQLKKTNAQLEHQYRSGYDLKQIEEKALALGMIPKEEAQTITATVTIPEPEPEPGFWEDVIWFFSGLFA